MLCFNRFMCCTSAVLYALLLLFLCSAVTVLWALFRLFYVLHLRCFICSSLTVSCVLLCLLYMPHLDCFTYSALIALSALLWLFYSLCSVLTALFVLLWLFYVFCSDCCVPASTALYALLLQFNVLYLIYFLRLNGCIVNIKKCVIICLKNDRFWWSTELISF
jgi:hypothetical protein